MIYEINTQYGGKVKVQPRVELYTVKDAIMGKELYGIAIDLDEQDGGYPMPFARLTANFGEFIGLKNAAYIDTNNCKFADQLLKAGIAQDTGLTKVGAYCRYPLWIFDEKFLKVHGAENYAEYEKAYNQYMGIETTDTEPEPEENEGSGFVINQ